ncbi:MAG: hypothetical protein ACYC6Z_07590 [Thermoleophilia bacterium]
MALYFRNGKHLPVDNISPLRESAFTFLPDWETGSKEDELANDAADSGEAVLLDLLTHEVAIGRIRNLYVPGKQGMWEFTQEAILTKEQVDEFFIKTETFNIQLLGDQTHGGSPMVRRPNLSDFDLLPFQLINQKRVIRIEVIMSGSVADPQFQGGGTRRQAEVLFAFAIENLKKLEPLAEQSYKFTFDSHSEIPDFSHVLWPLNNNVLELSV